MTEPTFLASSLLRTRAQQEADEVDRIAPFATRAAESAGRLCPEPRHAYRTEFQRDRDRVLHSRAFRRLEHKTQVFVDQEGDHYRNRLTHSLEGAQIARTVSRVLCLNEDLAEAIALAHDLGHPPFGHAGERVLSTLMESDGGFDHNRQTLRVVDLLEERYPGLSGLNLTTETREGVLKHGCNWDHPVEIPALAAQRSLESQAANVSDEIAYIHHDLEDGLRSRILQEEALAALPLWRDAVEAAAPRLRGDGVLTPSVRRSQTLISLIDRLVTDLLEASAERLERSGVASPKAAREWPEPLIAPSVRVGEQVLELKRFLLEEFYRHPRVVRMTQKAEGTLAQLFAHYYECFGHERFGDERSGREGGESLAENGSGLLPTWVRTRSEAEGEARAVSDYVAGMTDRFAIAEHRRLFGSP
jgi:dGTPase